MSLNLHCKEMDLPQLCTNASFLVFSANEKGNPDGGWRGVARRLVLHLRYDKDRSLVDAKQRHGDTADYREWADAYATYIEDTIERIEALVKEGKPLHFSVW